MIFWHLCIQTDSHSLLITDCRYTNYHSNYRGGDCMIFIQLEKLFLSESFQQLLVFLCDGGSVEKIYEADAGESGISQ